MFAQESPPSCSPLDRDKLHSQSSPSLTESSSKLGHWLTPNSQKVPSKDELLMCSHALPLNTSTGSHIGLLFTSPSSWRPTQIRWRPKLAEAGQVQLGDKSFIRLGGGGSLGLTVTRCWVRGKQSEDKKNGNRLKSHEVQTCHSVGAGQR